MMNKADNATKFKILFAYYYHHMQDDGISEHICQSLMDEGNQNQTGSKGFIYLFRAKYCHSTMSPIKSCL